MCGGCWVLGIVFDSITELGVRQHTGLNTQDLLNVKIRHVETLEQASNITTNDFEST